MAREKEAEKSSPGDWLRQHLKDLDESQPVIRSRYCVIEVTPSKRYSDEYQDGWTQQKQKQVSDWKDTKEELQSFLDKFEPDEGNTFAIRKENLRAIQQWVGY